ncbi:MAG: hypothetical protein WA919_04840 [Coleofasciculaceae cyanobacterium]
MASRTKAKKSSQLVVAQANQPTPLPGNRPITPSNFEVTDMISAAGERPVSSSHFEVTDIINISGSRPIVSGSLKFVEGETIFGNRPIASNEIDDERDLMGYLD